MVVVLTVDQQDSRSRPDGVPMLLEQLQESTSKRPLRPFQRTVGDEVQGVVDDPETVVELLGALLRTGDWHLGVGLGETETPLPEDARAGRGAAYLAAREAVNRAKSAPHRVRVVGGDPYRTEHLETAVWLWAGILERRTERGWQVYDAFAEGLSYDEAGHRLGITQSAVSQRAQAAGLVDEQRARALVRDLLAEQLGHPAPGTTRRGRESTR
jgi:hypothetical protein